jgi:hypothetical protein
VVVVVMMAMVLLIGLVSGHDWLGEHDCIVHLLEATIGRVGRVGLWGEVGPRGSRATVGGSCWC